MKQHEAVILAMQQLGGYASLGQLYQLVPTIPDCAWRTKTPFASIRRIVQTHPEFFRVRPGVWGLTSQKGKILTLFSQEGGRGRPREYSHYFFQGLVAEIGNLEGFHTFIPSQDKNKPFGKSRLGDIATLQRLDDFTYKDVLRHALTIDVCWINPRRFPHSFFEIEHSTDFSGALLKFLEFQDFRVNFYVVADRHRKREFESKIALGAFVPIKPFVKYWDYDSVSDLHAKLSASALAQKAMP
jgi:hypothetical protein